MLQTNKFVQKTEPWDLAKKLQAAADEETRRELDMSIYLTVEALRLSGIFLQAFIPEKAKDMLDILGVEDGLRTFGHAEVGTDLSYGVPKRSPGKGKFDGLFPPLPVED
jgi:methionyl-tRNA synthetase